MLEAALVNAGAKLGGTLLEQAFKVQNPIAQRVSQAREAGIHPLYALGANVSSPSVPAFSSMGSAVGSMGQDVSRAQMATAGDDERAMMTDLAIERAGLQNELLRSQIARLNANSNPPFVSEGVRYLMPGQTGSGMDQVKSKPLEQTGVSSVQPSSESGAIPDVGYARTTTGHAPVPSKDVKERIEDQIIPEIMWAIRNNLLPSFGSNLNPPPVNPGEGQKWIFDPFKQEYVSVPRGGYPPRWLNPRRY